MMEMQGAGHSNTRRLPPPTGGYAESPERRMGPGHFSPPPPELPKHLSRGPSREHIPEQMKNKIEVQVEIYNVCRSTQLQHDIYISSIHLKPSQSLRKPQVFDKRL